MPVRFAHILRLGLAYGLALIAMSPHVASAQGGPQALKRPADSRALAHAGGLADRLHEAMSAATSLASSQAAPAAPSAGVVTVTVANFTFSPSVVTITTGTTVVWQWIGGSHTTTSDDGFWNASLSSGSQTFSRVFTSTGTFNYHCIPHGGFGMVGKVIVVPDPSERVFNLNTGLGYATVQSAVDAASSGHTLSATTGVYTEGVSINKSLTLIGNGSVVDGENVRRVLTVTGASTTFTLTNATLRNGNGVGGLSPGDGGCVLVAGAAVILNNSRVQNCAAGGSGGGASVGSLLVLNAGSVISNSTAAYGGGVYASGGSGSGLVLNGGAIVSNVATVSGGGVAVGGTGTAITITSGLIATNTAANSGGGVWMDTGTSGAWSGGLVANNVVTNGSGGGVYALVELTISGTHFVTNSATSDGAAVYASSALRLINVSARENFAGSRGGGAYSDAGIEAVNADFVNNVAAGDGGGIHADTVALTHTRIISNSTAGYGGGVYAASDFSDADSHFVANATTGYGSGGGLFAPNSAIISGTRFIANTAASQGGGAFLAVTGLVFNALFARNFANGGGNAIEVNDNGGSCASSALRGPALPSPTPSVVTILHTTVASSSLASGSGIEVSCDSAAVLTNTIITNHDTGYTCNSSVPCSDDSSLIFGNTTDRDNVGSTTNPITGALLFVNPDADDYHLRFGNAAIDSGVDVGVYNDIDGQKRRMGKGFDVGYDEYRPTVFVPSVMRAATAGW